MSWLGCGDSAWESEELPSRAWNDWTTIRAAALDEIEHAHARVGGTGPGRRHRTQQLNQAYALLLSAQFQGFCRDLHDDCINHVLGSVVPGRVQVAVGEVFELGRKMDTGNPNPGNIGSDFDRFGVHFWDEVQTLDTRNRERREHLADLNRWRNAIAHHHFDPAVLGGTTLRLQQVRAWRQACHQLAVSFDEVMRSHLQLATGTLPW